MLALIDGDILLYKVGFSCQDKTGDEAILQMDEYINDIVFNAEAWDYKLYLTDSLGNFRHSFYDEYKGNRVQEKPKHYKLLKEYVIEHEAAIIAWGQEADDALGIEQTILGDESIICSIDKDLLMIPGWHYNLNSKIKRYIKPDLARYYFWKQVLTGDTVDNIPGLKGIGPKKAEKILEGCDSGQEFKDAVFEAYKGKYPDLSDQEVKELIERNGRLLWIRRYEGQLWDYDQSVF